MIDGMTDPQTRRIAAAGKGGALISVVLLAVAAANLAWSLLAPLNLNSQSSLELPRANPSLSADVSVLSVRNIFIDPNAAAGAAGVIELEEDLPITTVQLVLKGTIDGVDGGETALIRTPDNAERSYKVGEQIIRGVSLDRVESTRVIIRRNNRREQLLLENRPEIFDRSFPEAQPLVLTSQTASDPRLTTVGQLPLREVAGSYLPILEANGLAADDIALAIDGNPVPSQPQAIEALFNRLRTKGTVTVTVLRDGKQEEVSLTVPSGLQP